ncbi:hypothetical protein [Aquicoccus sp. SU-CL01552]|uniref:hypothetical protein n=1 Tax=Aquicoccus sp. SU-CL01552 TaxID=3127656 RepID=UPI00310ACFC7
MEKKMRPIPTLPSAPTRMPPPAPAHVEMRDLDSPPIDSETAALLRCWLQPLIARATSWEGLNHALARHGHALAFRGGRLCLIAGPEGTCICSMRFLGVGLKDLVARLGRPAVRPLPGHSGEGELCCPAARPA